MKFRNMALLLLLVTAPISSAYADSNENMASKLIRVSREYQIATVEERANLKPALEEASKLSDAYLRELSASGEKSSEFRQLADALHQAEILLHS